MLYNLIPELDPPILIIPLLVVNTESLPSAALSNIPLLIIYTNPLSTLSVVGFKINANFNLSLDL
jgi:hypothetical protein